MWQLPNNVIYFKFKNQKSLNFGLGIGSQDRTLFPSRRWQKLNIPSRSGAYYDTNNKAYDERVISLKCIFVTKDYKEVRKNSREIAKWLAGSGRLYFSDEPDKYYEARVEGGISIEDMLATGEFTVNFICEPFAYREQTIMNIATGINPVKYNGTAETPTLIIIKNNNSFAVTNIQLTLKKRGGE